MTTTAATTVVHVHHADPVRDEPIPRVSIVVDLAQPKHDLTSYADEAGKLFRADAKKIADALDAALPGGTLAALLVEMLQRKTDLLRVPVMYPNREER